MKNFEDKPQSLLTFRVGPVLCCAPSLPVQGIITPPKLTHPPGSDHSQPGIFRHDSHIVKVIELRQKFGISPDDQTQPGNLIITLFEQKSFAFWVDQILDVFDFPKEGWGPIPPAIPREIFTHTLLLKDRIHLYCELEKLLTINSLTYLKNYIQQLQAQEKMLPKTESTNLSPQRIADSGNISEKTSQLTHSVLSKPKDDKLDPHPLTASNSTTTAGITPISPTGTNTGTSTQTSTQAAAESLLITADKKNIFDKTKPGLINPSDRISYGVSAEKKDSHAIDLNNIASSGSLQHDPNDIVKKDLLRSQTKSLLSTANINPESTKQRPFSSSVTVTKPADAAANYTPALKSGAYNHDSIENETSYTGIIIFMLFLLAILGSLLYYTFIYTPVSVIKFNKPDAITEQLLPPIIELSVPEPAPAPAPAPAPNEILVESNTQVVVENIPDNSLIATSTSLAESSPYRAEIINSDDEIIITIHTPESVEAVTEIQSKMPTQESVTALTETELKTELPTKESVKPLPETALKSDISKLENVLTPREIANEPKINTVNPILSIETLKQNELSENPSNQKLLKEVIHIVVKGDTLWAIAKKYVNDPFLYPELARLSNIQNPHRIYPGNRVRIRFVEN